MIGGVLSSIFLLSSCSIHLRRTCVTHSEIPTACVLLSFLSMAGIFRHSHFLHSQLSAGRWAFVRQARSFREWNGGIITGVFAFYVARD